MSPAERQALAASALHNVAELRKRLGGSVTGVAAMPRPRRILTPSSTPRK